ncbi:alpha/beta hydrolase [Chelonobacter oris]|uniref:alpha/beta hydrolase n=1 Tax=Chelonobacter oris TaxID=505317 RepID=UPI0009FFBB07|nr:alpha/beta hydrolase [Chelonobacter oris]
MKIQKRLFSILLLGFAATTLAQDFKTLDRLAPEYQANAAQWATSITDVDEANRRHQIQLDLAQQAAQPNEHIRVPAESAQPEVDLYLYRPKTENTSLPAIYFIHGGGYLFGAAKSSGDNFVEMAEKHQAVVISVEYRLATQAPFPADLNDAYHGLSYVFRHAEKLGIDPTRIVLMGESAGGGLTARLALYTRDQGQFKPKGQILIYPMLDYRTGTAQSPYQNDYAGEFVWTAASNRFGWQTLRGNQPISEAQMAYFSPSSATDLTNLPATFLLVGDLDLFVNEDIDYANRLIAAGVQTELHVLPRLYHAFEHLDPTTAQSAEYKRLRDNAVNAMFH